MTTKLPPSTSSRSPWRRKLCAAFFALAFVWIPTLTQAAIPGSERVALIAFYNSTYGDSWGSHTGWLGAAGTECDWFGVTCDAQRSHVLRLGFYSNNLQGRIPPEIGQLSSLEGLALASNRLTGNIPKSLATLPNLNNLNLSGNSLVGKIPEELANLTKLANLSLSYNQLTGKIPEGLNALWSMDLSHNRLTGRIPESMRNVSAWALDLQANQLSGPIPSFNHAPLLAILRLSQNCLTGNLPPDLADLKTLLYLELAGNRLTGEIPAAFSHVRVAEGHLDLRWNGLWSHDPALVAFLNSKQTDGVDFQATQTMPPEGLGAGSPTGSSLAVSWSPILYQADAGGYQVLVASQPQGPFTLAGAVPSKATGWYQVTGLQRGTTYYFSICSATLAHPPSNQSNLMSPPSAVVAGTTLPW